LKVTLLLEFCSTTHRNLNYSLKPLGDRLLTELSLNPQTLQLANH